MGLPLKDEQHFSNRSGGGGPPGAWARSWGEGGSGKSLLAVRVCGFPNHCDTRGVLGMKPGGRMFVSKGEGEGCECCIYPCASPHPHRGTKESFILDSTWTKLH